MITFSSEELYVLASLMGREYIIGVEGETLMKNAFDLQGLFTKYYSELEERGLFEYRMDGTLLLEHDIKKMIMTLNKADCVFVISTDINGYYEKVNYLSYKKECCRITDKGSIYSLEVLDSFDCDSIKNIYGVAFSGNPAKKFSIPLSSFKYICELFNSFNESEAVRLLSELLHDSENEYLLNHCLTTKKNMFVMKEYKRTGNRMVNINNLILRFIDGYILSFSICDGDTVLVNAYKKENY